MSKEIQKPVEKYDSVFSLFVRVFWTLIGNVIAFFTLIAIFNHRGKPFCIADIIFFCTIAAIITARLIDITVWGDPHQKDVITMADWRKYAVIFVICSTALWILVHIINYAFINK